MKNGSRISKEEVLHIARLARLSPSPEEIDKLTREMDSILGFFERLKEIDTTGIEPTAHAVELTWPFREDEVRPSLPVDEVLSNAPERGKGMFKVKKVIE
jgi:aspartyl-tRNA(Asn)/glutamyl-tRNA(Gln) amidotransferase subunit C